ncbi:MAG: hypothetical protein HZB76_05880 [Chlamydiae bacterium]|nr:hypothetical protein [Chlamydiota bacterium]
MLSAFCISPATIPLPRNIVPCPKEDSNAADDSSAILSAETIIFCPLQLPCTVTCPTSAVKIIFPSWQVAVLASMIPS